MNGAGDAGKDFEAFMRPFGGWCRRDAPVNELLLGSVAVGAGLAAGGLIYLALRPRRAKLVPLEVVEEEIVPAPVAAGPRFEDDPFSVAAPPPRAAALPEASPLSLVTKRMLRPTYDPEDPPEFRESAVTTEWARRQVGPVDRGRQKGVCSGCGTHLSISQERPLRVACPVCGRTRLLAA